jgi:hypothetical protein
MKEKSNELNLPAIKKGGDISKVTSKSIQSLDLNKKNAVASVLKDKASSVQETIFKREQGLDLVLVGDLTASMTEYHELLKAKFVELCSELFPLIKNLRIGLVFYLDHDPSGAYGPDNAYITRVHKLTTNTQDLIHFIKTTTTGNGYDLDEAVEDALHDLNSNMNWKESSSRSVVIFGDASPHPQNECPLNYDFFNLTKNLYEKGVTINSVYCGKVSQNSLQKLENKKVGDFNDRLTYLKPPNFFSWIANVTGGMVIGIEKIEDLVDIILAAAAKDSGNLDELEKKMKESSPKKLNLIQIARNAEQRKRLGGVDPKMIR